jgi:ribose-phosphate pyrophosphokinase
MAHSDRTLVFSLPDDVALGDELVWLLDAERGEVERKRFPDGERYQRVLTRVDQRRVVLVGAMHDDASTLQLFDLACALVKEGALRLELVVPYFGYSTMERAIKSGEVVTAKTRARLLSAIPPASYGNRVLLLDLHAEGIPHYFEGGLTATHVYAKTALVPAIRRAGGEDFVLASTDAGRAKWVESLANDMHVDAALILKRRISGDETRVNAVNANVAGRRVVIYDDMIRTGGSLIGAAEAYRAAGASGLVAVCTHGIFPGDAWNRLNATGLFDTIIATDSHPNARHLKAEGLELVPIARLFAPHLTAAVD